MNRDGTGFKELYMKQKMVVTNLRIPEKNYLIVKSAAAESGISVNEYLNRLLEEGLMKQQLGFGKDKRKRNENYFWDLPRMMEEKEYRPMGASEEDKVIYGLDDK